jgi:hypothetical protein
MTSYIITENMKQPKKQEIYAPADVKIPSRLGGGTLKERVIRELPSKKVVSYALAYINPLIFSGDNGRYHWGAQQPRLLSSPLYGFYRR